MPTCTIIRVASERGITLSKYSDCVKVFADDGELAIVRLTPKHLATPMVCRDRGIADQLLRDDVWE